MMEETTSLLPNRKKAGAIIMPMEDDRRQSNFGFPCQHATRLLVLPLVVAAILYIVNLDLYKTSAEAPPLQNTSIQREETTMLDYDFSVEQNLDLLDLWKQYISWQRLCNQTKAKWGHATKKTNLTEVVNAENIRNHSLKWFNASRDRAHEWWEDAHEYFKNLSDQILQYEQESNDKTDMLADQLYGGGERKSLEPVLVYMNHSRAFKMLLDTTNKDGALSLSSDYFLINRGWETQINQAYCAVASSVAILNSLRGSIDLPLDPIYDPYPFATQSVVFNDCTDADAIQHNATFDGILSAPYGLNLETTRSLLQCNLPASEWTVEAHHVDKKVLTIDDIRQTMKDALLNPSSRVLINYHRAAAGQIGGGHFSPIGSYSTEMDAFLIMDVAKYKYPAVWIPTILLYRSLASIDPCGLWDGPAAQVGLPSKLLHPKSLKDLSAAMDALHCENAYRGYIIVRQKERTS